MRRRNVVPEVTRRMYDMYRNGDTAGAMQWQYRILELFESCVPVRVSRRLRAAAELRGFRFGQGRQPKTRRKLTGNAASVR